MPHFTVVIGSEGPVIDLTVAVNRTWQQRLDVYEIIYVLDYNYK
jgi:hypothetical protein